MLKKLFLLLLLSLSLFGRDEMKPVQSCEAFNNMKHSQNTHHVVLDTQKNYTVLDHHKGQYLLLIKGEQPAQRWVDEGCFSLSLPSSKSLDVLEKKTSISEHTNKYENEGTQKNMLLALSWHNAFCETHRYKKECKRDMFTLFKSKQRETHFILHGLWPQPANKAYCGVEQKYITMDKYNHWNKLPEAKLTPQTKEKLSKIMPGVRSNLHRHEWYKHGTCYGTDAEQYFTEAIALVEAVHDSEVSTFFEKNIGKRVTLKQVRAHFDSSFGQGTGKSVEMKCQKGLITELWLHLGGESDDLGRLLKNGKKVRRSCERGIVDRAGFTKELTHRSDFTKETSQGAVFGR